MLCLRHDKCACYDDRCVCVCVSCLCSDRCVPHTVRCSDDGCVCVVQMTGVCASCCALFRQVCIVQTGVHVMLRVVQTIGVSRCVVQTIGVSRCVVQTIGVLFRR